jgi:hypothetical protein
MFFKKRPRLDCAVCSLFELIVFDIRHKVVHYPYIGNSSTIMLLQIPFQRILNNSVGKATCRLSKKALKGVYWFLLSSKLGVCLSVYLHIDLLSEEAYLQNISTPWKGREDVT